MPPSDLPEPSVRLTEGWHCLHLYYQVDHAAWNRLTSSERQQAREQTLALLDPQREGAPIRLQTSVVSGHKADLGLMLMDPDPLKLDEVKHGLSSSLLGPASRRGIPSSPSPRFRNTFRRRNNMRPGCGGKAPPRKTRRSPPS